MNNLVKIMGLMAVVGIVVFFIFIGLGFFALVSLLVIADLIVKKSIRFCKQYNAQKSNPVKNKEKTKVFDAEYTMIKF